MDKNNVTGSSRLALKPKTPESNTKSESADLKDKTSLSCKELDKNNVNSQIKRPLKPSTELLNNDKSKFLSIKKPWSLAGQNKQNNKVQKELITSTQQKKYKGAMSLATCPTTDALACRKLNPKNPLPPDGQCYKKNSLKDHSKLITSLKKESEADLEKRKTKKVQVDRTDDKMPCTKHHLNISDGTSSNHLKHQNPQKLDITSPVNVTDKNF